MQKEKQEAISCKEKPAKFGQNECHKKETRFFLMPQIINFYLK